MEILIEILLVMAAIILTKLMFTPNKKKEKYLYLIKRNTSPFSEEFLNRLGEEGYELVLINKDNSIYEYVFKKTLISK